MRAAHPIAGRSGALAPPAGRLRRLRYLAGALALALLIVGLYGLFEGGPEDRRLGLAVILVPPVATLAMPSRWLLAWLGLLGVTFLLMFVTPPDFLDRPGLLFWIVMASLPIVLLRLLPFLLARAVESGARLPD